MNIRNIAIIAHVDHGKTTLVDQLLKLSGTLEDREQISERAMDSNALERERGITILAKNTAINYKDYRINIMDTPGHADFGGEVERIMNMVDGVLLVVDAYEGTMPQTRFVLKKALAAKVKPIVVINKVDRPVTRIDEVMDEVLELFMELGADDDQLEFPTIYTSALQGTSSLDPDISTQVPNMDCLFDMIIKEIPEPLVDVDGPLQFQPALLDYNDYVGRIGIGRIQRGKIHVNESVTCVRADGSHSQFRIQKLYGFIGLHRIEIEEASAGDIVAIAGLADIGVGETVCTTGQEEALPLLHVDEPTIQMVFGTNTSPFAGQDGKFVTARQIEERLFKETNRDVSLKIERIQNREEWIVSGRGELHLSILIENMRREGYEFAVSKAEVLYHTDERGRKLEPMELAYIDVPDEFSGSVIQKLSQRKGELLGMTPINGGYTRLQFSIPSRGLIGYRGEFLTDTKGNGIINTSFEGYEPYKGDISYRKTGSLIAYEDGEAVTYGLFNAQDRGTLFIGPGEKVYAGMIVGENPRTEDIEVNVCKTKHLTNTRSSSADEALRLVPPKILSLEQALDYIDTDELLEVTPNHLRIRKKILDSTLRYRANKK